MNIHKLETRSCIHSCNENPGREKLKRKEFSTSDEQKKVAWQMRLTCVSIISSLPTSMDILQFLRPVLTHIHNS